MHIDAMRLRISEIRARRGMTQADLADKVGMTSATISRIESGQLIKGAERLIRIARALGVDVSELFEPAERDNKRLELLSLVSRLDPADHELAIRLLEGLARQHSDES